MSDQPILQPVLVWFRRDLRLADNPALAAAVEDGAPVVALYVLDEVTPGQWPLGAAARWWLHHSLRALGQRLAGHRVQLVLHRGEAGAVVQDVARRIDAAAVYWNRCYEPAEVARDKALKQALRIQGLKAESYDGAVLAEPWLLTTAAGGPYKVFTPFWRALRRQVVVPPPQPAPKQIRPYTPPAGGDRLSDWRLPPTAPDWAGGLADMWQPGETGAMARLDSFLGDGIAAYSELRNRPDLDGTSGISAHLHWGELSDRQIWHAAQTRALQVHGAAEIAEPFQRQLGWRAFNTSLLFHFPDLPDQPLRAQFAGFPWAEDGAALAAWQQGRTGYPLVDAGMRQLWATGWMHNRVRMVAASFLIKHLLLHWRHGEAWFWDTLVDADLANNAANWQWVAGCGADAAPYFRIFNPVAQGERFDPDGSYVRRWLPDLSRLPNPVIHKPWTATDPVLSQAGVRLGETYPAPIVDHGQARARALDAYAAMRADR